MPQGQGKGSQGQTPQTAAKTLGAGGAIVSGLGPAAAGLGAYEGAKQAPKGLALTAKAVAEITAETLERVRLFQRARRPLARAALVKTLEQAYPERTPEVIDSLVREEMGREKEFSKRMEDRLKRDLPEALKILDPDKRRERVQKILEREQRYLGFREDAMHDRAIAAAERLAVKELSPKGAFWKLSPLVNEHTPGCLLLGDRFWPWEVLDDIHPPLHHGCRCQLLTLPEAVERDYMDPEQADGIDVADAKKRAREALKADGLLNEILTAEEWRTWVAELQEAAALGGAMLAFYPTSSARKKLAGLPDADEPADQIHLTLFFLTPDASTLDDKTVERLRAACAAAASRAEPLKGEVGGLGVFAGDGKEHPLIALADVPGLNEFRSELAKELKKRRVGYADDHGFTPHITLSYLPAKKEHPEAKPPAKIPLEFGELHLVMAGKHDVFKLGEALTESELRDRQGRWSGGGVHPFHDAFHDVVGARTYRDKDGNYRYRKGNKPGGPVTPWSDAVRAEFSSHIDFLNAANDYIRPIKLPLREASVLLRYPRGTKEGGEFMPHRGAHGHPISNLKRGLLRRLVPELPTLPSNARARGAHRRVAGHHVFVPEQRRFERSFGGKRYISPAGTTEVYRGGKLHEEPPHVTGSPLDLTVKRVAMPEYEGPKSEEVRARIRRALIEHKKTTPPVFEGQPGWTTDESLRAAGFIETDFRSTRHGLQFSYRAPDGASNLHVIFDKSGSKVSKVLWEPKRPRVLPPPLERPPRTFEEFGDDLMSYASQTAREHGKHALINTVGVDDTYIERTAEHHWDGSIDVSPEIRSDVLTAAATRARGGELTAGQRRAVYASTQAAIHEALHAANPISRADYGGADMVLEEGLTEELSHIEAVKHLIRQGQNDVVQWVADHPSDPQRVGTYLSYRGAIDDLLNEAKIAPEDREAFIARLKLDTDPRERINVLARALSEATGKSEEEEHGAVIFHLVDRGKPNTSWHPTPDWAATPMLASELTAQPAEKFELAGDAVLVGDLVNVNRPERDAHGDFEQRKSVRGTVLALHDRPEGWSIDVRYDDGRTDYAVLPRQIRTVEHEGEGRYVMGSAAASVEIHGQQIREGDVVRYDGRLDGGFSEARVVRILRAENPQLPGADTWLLEATTTNDSLRPGQRVMLTNERVGGVLEPVEAETVFPSRGGRRLAVPATLDRRARLDRYFAIKPGDELIPTRRLVPLEHPGGSRLQQEVNRLMAPEGVRKPSLQGVERPDGRIDVLDGSVTVHAAQQAGFDTLPVDVNWVPREAVLAAIEHRIAAQESLLSGKEGGDARRRSMVFGLRKARQIIENGGGQDEILSASLEAAKLDPEHLKRGLLKGETEDVATESRAGFEDGMRAAWLEIEAERQEARLSLYQKRHPTVQADAGRWEQVARDTGAPMMAADLVPTDWQIEHGYGQVIPNVGFQHIPYKPVPGGMDEKDALRMLHHYFTGKPDEWKGTGAGSKAQREEVMREAIGRWREHMIQKGWRLERADGKQKPSDQFRGLTDLGGQEHLFHPLTVHEEQPALVRRELERAYEEARARRGATGKRVDWHKLVYGGAKSLFDDFGDEPAKPPEKVVVDPKKLYGGEIIEDAAGKTWRVGLTGTQQQPTLTLYPLKGDPVVYPEAELPKMLLVKGSYGGHWKPLPPPKPVWDDAHTVVTTKPAGGSNDAMFAETPEGDKWLVKRYRGNEDRVATELLSNAIYRKLGVKVPEAGALHYEGKPAVAYPLLEGERRTRLDWKEPSPELGEGFMADALLANWDVIGMEYDNVLWDAEGHPFRVDQGGTLGFRAQGQAKPFGPVPSEVWTMAGPKGQAFGTMAITDEGKRRGARLIARRLTRSAIDELVDAAPFKDEKMREDVREALKARVAWMRSYAAGTVDEPRPAEGSAARSALIASQEKLELFPEQHVAVDAWADGWDGVVNDHLRAGTPKEQAQKEVRFLVGELDGILRHVTTRDDVVGYVAIPGPEQGKADLVGQTLTDKGYMGLALSAEDAEAAAGESGATVRVTLPAGSHALYLRGIPGVGSAPVEPEILLRRGTRLRVASVNDAGQLEAVLIS